MAAYATLTLSNLIDEAMDHLYRAAETPAEVAVAAAAMTTASDTSFDLSTADAAIVNVSDILEAPNGELLLVTAKSSQTFTVNRGFAGTSNQAKAWPAGTILKKNPTWERAKVRKWIERFFSTMALKHLPYVKDETVNVEANKNYAKLPTTVIRVLRVSYLHPFSGDWVEYDRWRDEYNLPTASVSTGALLRVGDLFSSTLDLFCTCIENYAWSATDDTLETQTISCPVGAVDLPALYAAMGMASRRPLSSIQLDKAVEFSEDEPSRRNMEVQLFKLLRGEFYQRLDEAKDSHVVPKRRTFRRMSRYGAPSAFG